VTRVIHSPLTPITHIMAQHFHHHAVGHTFGRQVRTGGVPQRVRCEGQRQVRAAEEILEHSIDTA
jgi:hypothetical protein